MVYQSILFFKFNFWLQTTWSTYQANLEAGVEKESLL